MSLTNPPDYVRYACTCGSLKPITKMYFCRHCLKVRCGYCVCHEVDSHYCTNCMENLPSSEARLKKNRCAGCFDCPNCFHTLSFRTTSGIRSAEDGTKTPGKVYYLACLFCRWTSRDVGIPDQTVVEDDGFLEEDITNACKLLMEKLQNQESEDSSQEFLKVALCNFTKLLPAGVTHQMIPSNSSYSYDFVTKCYSRLLPELCKALDKKWVRSNEQVFIAIKKVFVINNASALMFTESLTVLLSEFKRTEGPSEKLDAIIEILELIIKSDSLQMAVLNLCKPSKEETTAQEWVKSQWHNCLQNLLALPSYIFNKLHKNTPDCFVPDKFTNILTAHIIKCILYLGEIKRLEIDFDVKPLSVLFSKLIINYKSKSFLKDMFKILDSGCHQRDVNFSQVLQSIMLKLDQKSIECVAINIFKNCDEISVFRILNNCVLKSEHWKYVLCHKLPLLIFSNNDKILVNLINYLGNVHKCFQTDEELAFRASTILTDVLISLVSVWSDQFALVHTPHEQHLYITKAIVLAVKYITDNKKELNIDNVFINTVKLKFFAGVPVHLDSSVQIIRAMGMIASELFVKYVNIVCEEEKEETFSLQFDYSKLKDDSLSSVESVKKVVDLISFSNKEDFDDLLYELMIDCEVLSNTEHEEQQHNKISDKVQRKNSYRPEILNSALSNDVDDEDDGYDLDSDDDFEPYDTSNDTKLAVKKKPSYLRDLIDGFQEDKDADIWVGSLEVCESLIYNQLPQDDVSLGLEILDILLGLEKQFYCEDFEKLRFTAALAIVVVNPQQSAEFLCSKFHEDFRRYSISHRMLMLDLLSGGARVLSGVSRKSIETDERAEPFTLQTQLKNKESNWQVLVKNRIECNTRRFFKPRNAPNMNENKFSKVAGSFLFPLLRGSLKTTQIISYHGNSTDTLNNDPHMLLVHFLQTCAIIMVSALNCPVVLRMAKELLEATWNLRFHRESKVREAVIGCIASVILSVPSHQLYSDLWDEVSEAKLWLSSVANSEGIIGGKSCEVSTQCRAFAAQVTLLISDALNKTKDFS